MRDVAITVYSLVVIWIMGFLLIRRSALFRGESPVFVYGAAFGIGGGVLGLVLLVSSGVGGRLHLIWGYLILLVAALLTVRFVRKEKSDVIPGGVERRVRLIEICLLGAFAPIVLTIIVSGTFGPVVGDGWAIWAFKAKVFFLGQQVDLAFLKDNTRFGFAHLDYPLLLPFLEWWVYAHLGHVNDSVVRLVHVGFYFSLLAAFYGSLRAFAGRVTSLLCTVVLGLLAPGILNTLDGYADLIQGYYALLGFVPFVAWSNSGRSSDLASSALSFALGAHVKTEGLTWLMVIPASILLMLWPVRTKSPQRLRPLLTFLAISAPVAGMWPVYRWVFDIPLSPTVMWPTIDLVASRLPVILGAVLAEFDVRGLWQHGWGLLWAFTFLGCLRAVMHRSPSRFRVLCCWSPLVFQGLIVITIYLLTVAPLRWQLATSLMRVLFQLGPCCLWVSTVTLVPAEPLKR